MTLITETTLLEIIETRVGKLIEELGKTTLTEALAQPTMALVRGDLISPEEGKLLLLSLFSDKERESVQWALSKHIHGYKSWISMTRYHGGFMDVISGEYIE